MEIIDSLVTIIGQTGFPIAVAAYVLIVNNKTLDGVKESLNNNTAMIQRLIDKWGD